LKSGATSNKLNSKPSPVVELQVGHGDTQTTWPQYHDSDPVFEQGFVFTVINPHSDDLQIRVLDSGHKNAVIGTATIRTSDLLATPNLEYQKQPFSLKGLKGSGGGATIILEANVRCLKKSTSGSKTATSGSKLSTSGSKSSISGSASKVTHKKAEIKKKIEVLFSFFLQSEKISKIQKGY
jgi:Ca2+-dependent lipid-binding protein